MNYLLQQLKSKPQIISTYIYKKQSQHKMLLILFLSCFVSCAEKWRGHSIQYSMEIQDKY